jgi:phosphoribosylformylglycinamidine synthase
VIVFPGTWSDRDCGHALGDILGQPVAYIDHRARRLVDLDLVVLPGGFSYGDHLRCGAIARFAPVMDAVAAFADRGGLVLGICNGFQVLQEARMLPGALLRNASCEFRCEWTNLRVEHAESPFTNRCRPGQVLRIPISHGEGNFYAEPETIRDLEVRGQVLWRYCAPDGRVTAAANPNGSLANIAGISNQRGNVVGMMPHPERACEELLGSADGNLIFQSAMRSLAALVA